MSSTGSFGLQLVESLIARLAKALPLEERQGPEGGPAMTFSAADDPGRPAGHLRLWAGEGRVDRMLHVRLEADVVDTQLWFLFGRRATVMPHLHVQVVQFGADNCVYNADLIPRLDPVDHPGYFREVMHPLTKPYWKAVNDYSNVCSHAPGNPAVAAYLSPWSIGTSRPATRAELVKVTPSIEAYVDHWTALAHSLAYPAPAAAWLGARDERHLHGFFDEELDPRAWKGLYGLIGPEAGRAVRGHLMTPLN